MGAEEMLRAARAAWPGIDLSAEVFEGYVAARMPGVVFPAELYLACACSHGDARAIAAFEARCLSVIAPALARLRLGADVVAEVKQRLRTSLLVGGPAGARSRSRASR